MNLISSREKKRMYRYFVLAVIILLIILLKQFMSLLMLTTIFSYLALKAGQRIQKVTHLPRGLSISVVYLLVIGILVWAIDHGTNTVIQQIRSMLSLTTYSKWHFTGFWQEVYNSVQSYAKSVNLDDLIAKGFAQLNQVGHIVHVMYELILALLFSFIFSMTYPQLRKWSLTFIRSPYKKFFGEFYIIIHRFIIILGRLFEVQLMICMINTAAMVVVLSWLNFPYLVGFAMMIFILGLIPVVGVLISLLPLTITALIIGDWHTVLFILIAVAVIHFMESYFLHPHFMSQRTHMPILVILLNLIIMEKIFGVWGLIIGLPILTFLLDFFRIQRFKG